MNLALHGLFFQVIVSIVQFEHGFRFCSAGEPGYLDFDNLPETNFSCQGKVIGGYYADVEAGCQMFHVCTIGQKDEIMDIKFLCLNGTVFDQETRVCERVDEVDCSKSERFYNLNLELYGNNAVTLSLHDSGADDEDDPSDLEDHESQRTTSSRPTTTSSTTTTTPRPSISSTTPSGVPYQHSNGYPQHFQPQPRFPSVQTSQSKSLYDDKNGGYHHQYIYHTGDHRNNNVDTNNDPNNNNQNHNNNNNNQATSYQLFSNQGVSSTTGSPQIHQVRYSSTPSTQIQIHNDHQPTVSPIFHATSSTIQTLLNSNANSPALINPIFHNHGIASTTEQFTVHNNNPRETDEYRDDEEGDERNEENRRPLEAIQPTTQGKVSKLTISPPQEDTDRSGQQSKSNQQQQQQQQQQRITTSFLPTPASDDTPAVRSFYPTPRTSTKSSSSHVTHIHLPPPPAIPQLKPHQVTINLPPPDIQRIVQNPSPLLPSQSRVIVTAKASVSDESGRPLNSTQLVTLPLPTIPASYDDYKEGDVSFDPFYRDVPKVRNGRKIAGQFRWTDVELREKRSIRGRRDVEEVKKDEIDELEDSKVETGGKKEIAEVEAKGNADKKSENLKTESVEMKNFETKHRTDTNSQDKDDERFIVNAKESDEEEYVNSDDIKLKTVSDTRQTDAEEYVNADDDAIDSKIFEEPESQTSKEIEVRAVDQQDSKYSKDRSNRLEKGNDNSKNENSNSFGNSKRRHEEKSSRFSLLPEVIDTKSSGKHSSKKLQLKDEEKEDEIDEENYQENVSADDYYYYEEEIDDSSLKSNERDSVEHSKESPNKIASSKPSKSSSHQSKSLKTEDANEDEDYDLVEDATTQSNEASYEMSDEYLDSSQVNASPEDSREIQDDEPSMIDNTTQEFAEDFTTSTEQIESSEATTIEDKKSYEKHLSEGVLKFTDEIPSSEKIDEPEQLERSESVEENPQDYIDDNYEPESYKEQKVPSTTVETFTTMNIIEDTNTTVADDTNESPTKMSLIEAVEEKQNDQPQLGNKYEEQSIEKSNINNEALPTTTTTTTIITTSTTTTPATTTTMSTTTSAATTTTISTTNPATTVTPMSAIITTESTTTTTESITTPAATTTTSTTTTPATTTTTTKSTTVRPTPPKLFKPFTIRKSYVYIPPTTTPVPVKIKPRLHLLNPKPAKPPKSYNDLAPKPVIRKSPLFARKALAARTTTPYVIKNSEDSTDVPVEATEIPKIEEITLSPTTTTEVPTTPPKETSSQAATILSNNNNDENSGIKDNHVPISVTDSLEVSTVTESQTFTPYPILRITEAIENEGKESVKALTTSERSFVESNDVPNVGEVEISNRTPETTTIAGLEQDSSSRQDFSLTAKSPKSELPLIEPTSDSSMMQNNVATNKPELDNQTSIVPVSDEATTEITEVINRAPTLASIKAVNRRPGAVKRNAFFNCLEKEMYRFYADGRDCRLFHYCSPGFTSRQVLDFRFVCEEGTAFDEETQSCIHDVKSPKCRKRVW